MRYATSMTTRRLQARVKNGRLVLDEPTNLGEGEVVYLQVVDVVDVVDVVADDRDDLDDEERAELHRALDASIAEADAGQTEDFAAVIAALRPRP
jgi:hypothetical protein